MNDRSYPPSPSSTDRRLLYSPYCEGNNAAPSRGSQTLKRLRPAVSAVLLAWLAWRTDWHQIRDALGHLRPNLGLGAVGLYVVIQLVSSFRWQLLAQPLGFRQSLSRFAGFYFVGMFFNLLLPTSVGGDVVRAWYLDGRTGRRLDAFLSVLVDRASGLLLLLLLACAGVVCCPFRVPAWVVATVAGAAGMALAGLLTLPLVLRWTARMGKLGCMLDRARVYIGHPALVAATSLLSLGVQAGNVVLVWLIGRAIDAPIPDAYFWILVPLVSLLTLLPVSLNGMGIREGSTVLLLAPLGVSEGLALCLAILWFAVMAAVSLLGGLVYAFGYFPRPEVRTDHGFIGSGAHQGRTGQSKAVA
jgi:uncharacterized membrane protein YbhN (UPF0104 family)